MMTVEEAVAGRRSIRAFLPKPVPRELIERVLSDRRPRAVGLATCSRGTCGCSRAPCATRSAARRSAATTAARSSQREYNYYPVKWREPYLARRRACGWGLYGTLGIGREDKGKMHAQHARNFAFFDAPVGLVFSIDRDLEKGSWLDYGMFLQSIMVAARGNSASRPARRPPGSPSGTCCSAASASRPTRRWFAAWRSATRTRTRR